MRVLRNKHLIVNADRIKLDSLVIPRIARGVKSDKDGQAIGCLTIKTHPPDEKTTLYFDCIVRQDLCCLIQVFALPDDLMCRLKKPEEGFEHALESIRDLLDSWKMGAAFNTPLGCENPRLFDASAKWLLHTS